MRGMNKFVAGILVLLGSSAVLLYTGIATRTVPVNEYESTEIMAVNEEGGVADSVTTLEGSSTVGTEAVTMSKKEVKSVPESALSSEERPSHLKNAMFGNGCFWCVEHDLAEVEGVLDVVSGYAGGTSESPDYKNYAEGGHREVVLVTYDAGVVSYANLVEHIIKHGDPTDTGGSFKDRGSQYAPALYYENEDEKKAALSVIEAVNDAQVFADLVTLPVLPRVPFYPAEEYHQDYAQKNPLRYSYYRRASGRTAFIENVWGDDLNKFSYSPMSQETMSTNKATTDTVTKYTPTSWEGYVRPSDDVLRTTLSDISYTVTRKDGTERAGTSVLDKNYESGIYVDIISGEPLFSSRDKFDSKTGWPSFVKPISDTAVTLHEDRKLFSTRTEVRSRYADSHLGHVFDDGPTDRGGKRYCMNGAALRFIPKADMAAAGYDHWLPFVE
jgi:peptide methionine sulfoxide reductase msrA/msrB